MSPNDRLRKQQQAQARADRKLRRDLARGFAPAWRTLQARISRVAAELKQAGSAPDRRRLAAEHEFLRGLERDVLATVAVFTSDARRLIDQRMLRQAKAGAVDAEELLRASLPAGVEQPLPVAELRDLVVRSAPSAPLGPVLDRIAGDTAGTVRDALLEGLAAGFGPEQVAADMRRAGASVYWQTLRVARTELVGVYRRASLNRYRESRVVASWVWVARLDSRTCPVCVAMHGTIHDLDEQFGTHPNCRCAAAPQTVPWTELGVTGVKETRVQVEPGEAWLRRQPVDDQRRILGRGRHELWAAGKIGLADIVRVTNHPVWGEGRRVKPVRDLAAA